MLSGREQGYAAVPQGVELLCAECGVGSQQVEGKLEAVPSAGETWRYGVDWIEGANVVHVGHHADHELMVARHGVAGILLAVDAERNLQRVDGGYQLGQSHIAVALGVREEVENLVVSGNVPRINIWYVGPQGTVFEPA